MTVKLLVPDIGDFEKVEVIELLVKEGQEIKINDPVVTIESDKSSVEIPSTFSGKIESIKVKVGDKVSKGDLILNIIFILSLLSILGATGSFFEISCPSLTRSSITSTFSKSPMSGTSNFSVIYFLALYTIKCT